MKISEKSVNKALEVLSEEASKLTKKAEKEASECGKTDSPFTRVNSEQVLAQLSKSQEVSKSQKFIGSKAAAERYGSIERSKQSENIVERRIATKKNHKIEQIVSNQVSKTKMVSEEDILAICQLKNAEELKAILSKINGGFSCEKDLLETINMLKISKEDMNKYIENVWWKDLITEENITVSDKAEMMADFIRDIQDYRMIKEHPIFAPYNLSLADTSKIKESLKNGCADMAEIKKFLKKRNAALYEKLGGDSSFESVNGSDVAFNRLSNLSDYINGGKSIDSALYNSDSIKSLDFDVNGRPLRFLYKGELPLASKNIKIGEQESLTLIKSNMVTTDCLGIPEFIEMIEKNPEIAEMKKNIKIKIEKPNKKDASCFFNNKEGRKVVENSDILAKFEVDIDELIHRVNEKGFESLSSNESHVLTDFLVSVYKKMSPQQQKVVNESINSKGQRIYSIVQGMKEKLLANGGKTDPKTGEIVIDGVRFEDHCFMRMMDRNLANVVDFQQEGKLLSFEELVQKIVERAKNVPKQQTGNPKETPIMQGLEEHGIKLLLKFEDGKPVIDSIMQ